jgi:hypothetical protein
MKSPGGTVGALTATVVKAPTVAHGRCFCSLGNCQRMWVVCVVEALQLPNTGTSISRLRVGLKPEGCGFLQPDAACQLKIFPDVSGSTMVSIRRCLREPSMLAGALGETSLFTHLQKMDRFVGGRACTLMNGGLKFRFEGYNDSAMLIVA